MRIHTESASGLHSISLAGRFDAHEIPGFRTALEGITGDQGATMRLDLGEVSFVDSTALAELVRTQKTARAGGGQLILTSLSDPVRVILELTALTQVFTIEPAGATETAVPQL